MDTNPRPAEPDPDAAALEGARSRQVAKFPASSNRAAAPPREKLRRQAVVVLGMHRSGTSAVTEALSSLGGRLPERLLPPQSDNPRGFFEPHGIVEIHDRMLASAGTSWSDWDAFPVNWYRAQEADGYVRELADAVKADYGNARILLLKDPRICRFLPLWTRVFNESRIQPLFVLPFRNPLEVATSLRRRNGFSLAHTYLLWLRHVLDAEFDSRDFPRTFLHYEDFLSQPRGELDRLETQIPVTWPRKSPRAYHEIEEAVEASFRHHVASADDLVNRSDIFAWLRDAYQQYESLRENPLDQQALRHLDRVRSEFNQACEAFAPAVQGLQIQADEQQSELLLLRQELAALRQKGAELEAQGAALAGLQQIHDETQAALAGLQQTHSETQAALAGLQQTHNETQAAFAAARQDIDRLSYTASRIAEVEAALASESARASRAEAAIARIPELELQRDAARSENEQLRTQVADLSSIAQERDSLISRLAAASARINELAPALTRASELQAELAQERTRSESLAPLQEMLESSRAEIQQAREACGKQASEAARLAQRVRLLEEAVQISAGKHRLQNGLGKPIRYLYWAITFQLVSRYRTEQRVTKRMQIVSQSGLFDPDWYLQAYPDVAACGLDPLRHYSESGFLENRRPGANAPAASASALARQLKAI
jgi:hypothetical protein